MAWWFVFGLFPFGFSRFRSALLEFSFDGGLVLLRSLFAGCALFYCVCFRRLFLFAGTPSPVGCLFS
ncbi:hypothetical protein A2U01_0073334 [Trifolium medium]|uniref:Uncharacterized protein n=1 Tax=Trifolium medium TaxID=97028 RepID=A0A392SVZ8_9FABA|nr:hypothetical protein [Trifolium medium]